MYKNKLICTTIFAVIVQIAALPDLGKWEFDLDKQRDSVSVPKPLFKGSQIFVQIQCSSEDPPPPPDVTITWTLRQYICWQDYLNEDNTYGNEIPAPVYGNPNNHSFTSDPVTRKCAGHIVLEEIFNSKGTRTNNDNPVEKQLESRKSRESVEIIEPKTNSKSLKQLDGHPKLGTSHPVYTITKDGIYMLTVHIETATPESDFHAQVRIEMQSTYGFLSAVDWPLLPFYGGMCIVYVILGVIWLFVSFLQWRDLLRIQFWIGGVILLGMLEKATFYAEYQNINATGVSVKGAVLVAEWVSCGKRTLARMLVIIVSLGFGIVKPRLGPMLHRVVGTGGLYFILAAIESYLRVMHKKNDPSNQILVASIPLAVLDSAICWWIFTSLVQTTRTLRLRRNMVKLSLYRHFTNTLIFAVVASVVFMLYSIKSHRIAVCLTDWKELWVDEAFWHVLFSILLLVIMVLWRPTNNNQRYAFTPLLDNPEDDDDDEDEQFVSDAFGVKMRGNNRSTSPKPKSSTSQEEDLRWVEENIPSAMADATLPILDSDEEILNTKFEVSKMQ